MASKYVSVREKIRELITNTIMVFVKKKDLDYYQVIKLLKDESGASETVCEEILKDFISGNFIKEIRTLTIPDEEIEDYFKELKEQELKEKIELKEIDKELRGLKKEDGKK